MTNQVYLITFLLSLILISCGQNIEIGNDITIDSNINEEVENHISPLSNNKNDTLGLIYNTHVIWDSYEGDSLINSTASRDSLASAPFKSFYFFEKDSLIIIGEFGLISGFRYGFISKIKNETLTTHHFFCDEFPSFKHKITDSLDYCIEIKCPTKKIVVSELPNKESREPISGFIDFSTNEFYESGSDGVRKTKSRMKIYFRARFTQIKEKN